MRIDHQSFVNHKKLVSVLAMSLIVTPALSAGCFVESSPKQMPKVSSKSSAPAAQETYEWELDRHLSGWFSLTLLVLNGKPRTVIRFH